MKNTTMSTQRDIVVIGASAGGVECLRQLLGGLSQETSASLFVVQHVASPSPPLLDRILDQAGPLPVSVGKDGEPFQPGHVYVAASDRHLLVGKGRIITTRGPRENRSRPAIDPLFRSAAVNYGSRVIGVILSGMLDDGTAGLLAVKRCGGVAVVQDPSDALFSEMPQSALHYVEVDHTVGMHDMPGLLMRLASERSGPAVSIPHDLMLETRMAEAESGDVRETDEIGQVSTFTCPECSGPLWRLEGKAIERYRCHTGHAFTARALTDEMADATERALWVALQTMESRRRMLGRLARQESQRGRTYAGNNFASQADELQHHTNSIRQLLMDQRPSAGNLTEKPPEIES